MAHLRRIGRPGVPDTQQLPSAGSALGQLIDTIVHPDSGIVTDVDVVISKIKASGTFVMLAFDVGVSRRDIAGLESYAVDVT